MTGWPSSNERSFSVFADMAASDLLGNFQPI
jgi:hypothetical protein